LSESISLSFIFRILFKCSRKLIDIVHLETVYSNFVKQVPFIVNLAYPQKQLFPKGQNVPNLTSFACKCETDSLISFLFHFVSDTCVKPSNVLVAEDCIFLFSETCLPTRTHRNPNRQTSLVGNGWRVLDKFSLFNILAVPFFFCFEFRSNFQLTKFFCVAEWNLSSYNWWR
jgi:hypothetical protein